MKIWIDFSEFRGKTPLSGCKKRGVCGKALLNILEIRG
jgi:hypothetical protein